MQNYEKNKNGKIYRKYGLLGYFSGVALYRLRYVDLKLGGEVIRSLKAQGYQLSWLLIKYDTYNAFEIEVQCKSQHQINYIKTFSVKKNIAKLQQKLLMLQQ